MTKMTWRFVSAPMQQQRSDHWIRRYARSAISMGERIAAPRGGPISGREVFPMPTTRNDLPDNTRKAMIALLNARLVDAIDLRLAVKQAHWNVKGPTFIALHELF